MLNIQTLTLKSQLFDRLILLYFQAHEESIVNLQKMDV